MKLDAKTVAALTLDGKNDVIVFDDAMPGFGFRIRRGAENKLLRSWIVQFKRAGATRRMTLGAVEVLGAEAARAAAKKLLAKVALGEDPQADKRDRRGKDKLTLRSVIDEYLAHKKVGKGTLRDLTRYLTGPAFRPLHGMPVDTITRRNIAARLLAITREQGSIVAARSRMALSTFFVWSMQMGITDANPVIGTIKPDEGKPRERVLSDAELKAIWKSCADDDFGRIVRLLVLLAARRQEIGGMAWSEIDLERGVWTLPAQRSKNGKAHALPLVSMALAIIHSVPKRVSRDQLFGARSKSGFTAWDKCKQELDERCRVSDWSLHDVRRSTATKMADIGIAPHIIETVLNHQSGHKAGPAGIYNRSSYEREVAAALGLWADHVWHLTSGGADPT
jgi:integrase